MNMWEQGARQESQSYGSLNPSSDLKSNKPVTPNTTSLRVFAALSIGALLGVPFVVPGMAQAAWAEISQYLPLVGNPKPASPAILSQHQTEALAKMGPQSQAELLLERTINHYEGAASEITQRIGGWQEHLQLTPRLNSLITTSLNSNDLRVRAAGIEVDLVAMGVSKTPETVDSLIQQAQSGEKSRRVWALWSLGLLGNRGIQQPRITEALVSQLKDSDVEVRHWAVEGMAYLGTDETIEPLLQTFHDDPSPLVRERAACSLAQSGMLSQQQRLTIVPRLLDYTEDSSLDAQTHTWVYQALRDITAQNLPNDSSAWRNWYSTRG
jgi:HEAT repeat protein